MILGLEFTLFAYLLLAALYWLLRGFSESAALSFMVLSNIVFLYYINALLVIYLCFQLLLVGALYVFITSRPRQRSPSLDVACLSWLASRQHPDLAQQPFHGDHF